MMTLFTAEIFIARPRAGGIRPGDHDIAVTWMLVGAWPWGLAD